MFGISIRIVISIRNSIRNSFSISDSISIRIRTRAVFDYCLFYLKKQILDLN